MAYVDKINSIQVGNIAKVKGRSKGALRKSRGRLFGAGGDSSSAEFPSLPSDGTVTVDEDGVMSFPSNFSSTLTITKEELYGDANPAYTSQIGYSVWFKWDGDPATPQKLSLFQAVAGTGRKDIGLFLESNNTLSLYRFALYNGTIKVKDTDDLSNRGVNLYDGQWHHVYVGYSEDQSQTIANNCSEYHIVVDGQHEFVGTALNLDASLAYPTARSLGPTNLDLGGLTNRPYSIQCLESVIDTPLSKQQVQWLYDSGNGRNVRPMSSAALQVVEDIPGNALYHKTSLRTASGIDTSGLSSYEPFVLQDGALAIHEPGFAPYQKFNFPEKAYSMWFNVTQADSSILDIVMGVEKNDSQWHQLKVTYSSADIMTIEFDRRLERTGSTNAYRGQQTTGQISFNGTNPLRTSLMDDQFHHLLIALDSDGSQGYIKVWVDNVEVASILYSSDPNEMVVPYHADGTLFIDYEVEVSDIDVWLGSFNNTTVNTIYSSGPDLSAEPERSYWGNLNGGAKRYGFSGLNFTMPSNSTATNQGADWQLPINVPTGLATGDYFTFNLEMTGLGKDNGWIMLYDPTVASRTGNDFSRDSAGNFSWITAISSTQHSPYTSTHYFQLGVTGSNDKTIVDMYQVRTNVVAMDDIYDYTWKFTKEAAGTWAITLRGVSQSDGNIIELDAGTGFTLPSVMKVGIKGRASGFNWGTAELLSSNWEPSVINLPSTVLGNSTLYGDASHNPTTDVMTFDGTGDYATYSGDWKYTDAITFGAWFKTTASGDRRILSSHVRSGNPIRNGFLLYLNNGRLDFFEPSFSAGNFTITGPTGMNDGQWHHVALAWGANSIWTLYVDGQVYSTGNNGAQAPAYMSGWDLFIGANAWNGNSPYGFYVGDIGGVFVENETMSLAQIQAIYNAGAE